MGRSTFRCETLRFPLAAYDTYLLVKTGGGRRSMVQATKKSCVRVGLACREVSVPNWGSC